MNTYSIAEFRLQRELERIGDHPGEEADPATDAEVDVLLFRRMREFVIVVEDGVKRVTNMKWVVEDLTAVGKRI